jgi:hypothetical protein
MKQKLILTLSVLFVSIYSFGQSYNDLVKQAFSYYQAKDYKKSLDLNQHAFKI